MEYLVDGTSFHYSYTDLRENYMRFKTMTDEEFIKNAKYVLHFAIFACYIKEIPTYLCCSDKGIIHELTHLILEIQAQHIHEIRDLFNNQLQF